MHMATCYQWDSSDEHMATEDSAAHDHAALVQAMQQQATQSHHTGVVGQQAPILAQSPIFAHPPNHNDSEIQAQAAAVVQSVVQSATVAAAYDSSAVDRKHHGNPVLSTNQRLPDITGNQSNCFNIDDMMEVSSNIAGDQNAVMGQFYSETAAQFQANNIQLFGQPQNVDCTNGVHPQYTMFGHAATTNTAEVCHNNNNNNCHMPINEQLLLQSGVPRITVERVHNASPASLSGGLADYTTRVYPIATPSGGISQGCAHPQYNNMANRPAQTRSHPPTHTPTHPPTNQPQCLSIPVHHSTRAELQQRIENILKLCEPELVFQCHENNRYHVGTSGMQLELKMDSITNLSGGNILSNTTCGVSSTMNKPLDPRASTHTSKGQRLSIRKLAGDTGQYYSLYNKLCKELDPQVACMDVWY